MERIKRGAPSRKRKKSFNLCKIYILWLTEEILEKGLNEKWIGFFQENMRNADGTARRAKYKLKVTEYEE